VFSNSVSAAMMTAVKTSQLPAEAEQTARFVKELNDMFDCLNSRVQFDPNPLRCALSSTPTGNHVIDKLKSAQKWTESWKRTNIKTKKGMVRPPSFPAMALSIEAVLQLWDDLKNEGYTFLLTNRLTQDALDNEFSIARQRGG